MPKSTIAERPFKCILLLSADLSIVICFALMSVGSTKNSTLQWKRRTKNAEMSAFNLDSF